MAASNGVKAEEDFKVKMDPDGASPMSLGDIDEYEDTGELVIPKPIRSQFTSDPTPRPPAGWLLRLPKDLWQGLAQLNDDDEIEIGQIKLWEAGNGKPQKVRFELTPNRPGWDMIPKQYDLTPTAALPKNTFVFSEKNLPGFRPRQMGGGRATGSQDPLRAVDSKTGGPVKVEKPRQRWPRTIPKHTEMLGVVKNEFVCSPRDTEEYRRIRAKKEEMAKGKTKGFELLSGEAANKLHTAGMGMGVGATTSFITTSAVKKSRPQENKATRMDETELIDELVKLFKEFKFWPMSSLKTKLNQPEAWLREVLGKIGTLVKTGQAANTWALSNSYVATLNYAETLELKSSNGDDNAVKMEEIAPVISDAAGADDDEDGDEEDFEDVEMN